MNLLDELVDMFVAYYDVIEKKTKIPLMRLDFGMSVCV
jgi:hypothetical protein